MERLGAAGGRPHLFAALFALGLALAFVLGGGSLAIHRERQNVSAFAPDIFPLKTQGLVLQRAAAEASDVLPLYGSSELVNPPGVRAGDFFQTAPTGFQVSPVGKAGATSLILLQKIGALDTELRDKKVAVSLSSGWFLGTANPYWYEGNFSRFAASQLIFDSAIDLGLKRDIAARMIQYPHTLEKAPLLDFALRRLASASRFDQFAFYAVWPLGKLQDAIWDLQDHFAALGVLRGRKPAPRQAQILHWPTLIAKNTESAAEERKKQNALHPPRHLTDRNRDGWFHEHMNESAEWTDLELLLRILREIQARPLVISMPMNGPYFDSLNVSRAAREEFYERLRRLQRRYNFELVDFEEHDQDPDFLNPHLTAKGWILYDRVLDDFMHDRVPHT
ncbi:MAG: D-alanyl-lipoteichoic acid biosynthesis protein DltD [Chthoniobacterales bacterium]